MESDLQVSCYGARYCDDNLGMFPSIDPARDEYPGWSPYAYILDNPLKFVDPDGCGGVDPAINPVGAAMKRHNAIINA